jgi:segregation and condensation protein B
VDREQDDAQEEQAVVSENGEDTAEGAAAESLHLVAPLPLSGRVGSLLFVSPKPLTVETLAEYLDEPAEDIESVLQTLRQEFNEEAHGFVLQEVAGAWQLRTTLRSARTVQKLIPPRARRLSRAAAETLAVIAYKQPVQRAEIESIRGVDALPTIRTLLDAKLIRIVGRETSPGQPALYGTTNTFLEKFGLRDLCELPTVREILELSKEPGENAVHAAEENAVRTDDSLRVEMQSEREEPAFLPTSENDMAGGSETNADS